MATALAVNTTITSLNLESNSVSSGGIEALGGALRANGTLKELKLAHQQLRCSQRAEEAMATALESNWAITRRSPVQTASGA